MGARNPAGLQRLLALREPGRGYVWLAMCDKCGHASGMPVRLLIARYGELCPVDFSMTHLSCAECDGGGRVSARLARLCDPGCGRQRG